MLSYMLTVATSAFFCTQVLIVIVGLVLVFSPQVLVDNVHLGVAPTWGDFFVAIPRWRRCFGSAHAA